MQIPPAKEIVEVIHLDVLPAAGAAALVYCLVRLCGRGASSPGAAAAVGVAFVAANFSFENSTDSETGKLAWWNTFRLAPWRIEADDTLAWHWLPRAALTLLVVGLLSRWAGSLVARRCDLGWWWQASLVVWVPRILAAVVVSGWTLSERITNEYPLLRYQILTSLLVLWLTLDGLARSRPGGEVAAQLAMVFYAASGVLIYSHSKQFMDLAVVVGSAFMGVAVAAQLAKSDVSGAVPLAVSFLPCLLLGGRPSLISEVPAAAFWLVTLAPTAVAPFLLPKLSRSTNPYLPAVRTTFLLIPLAVATGLALAYETLPEEGEDARGPTPYTEGNHPKLARCEPCSLSPHSLTKSHPTRASKFRS